MPRVLPQGPPRAGALQALPYLGEDSPEPGRNSSKHMQCRSCISIASKRTPTPRHGLSAAPKLTATNTGSRLSVSGAWWQDELLKAVSCEAMAPRTASLPAPVLPEPPGGELSPAGSPGRPCASSPPGACSVLTRKAWGVSCMHLIWRFMPFMHGLRTETPEASKACMHPYERQSVFTAPPRRHSDKRVPFACFRRCPAS